MALLPHFSLRRHSSCVTRRPIFGESRRPPSPRPPRERRQGRTSRPGVAPGWRSLRLFAIPQVLDAPDEVMSAVDSAAQHPQGTDAVRESALLIHRRPDGCCTAEIPRLLSRDIGSWWRPSCRKSRSEHPDTQGCFKRGSRAGLIDFASTPGKTGLHNCAGSRSHQTSRLGITPARNCKAQPNDNPQS